MRKYLKPLLASLGGLVLAAATAQADPAAEPAAAAAATEAAPAIANPTTMWNHTWEIVLIELWVIGLIFMVIAVYLLIKYRAKSPDAVGTAQPLNLDKALAWALVPAALFMAEDFLLAAKGWSLWNVQRTVPAGAMEVKVTGNQWFFEYDYGNGVKSEELIVPVGKPVVLRMTSNDVLHSFGLNEYRVKEDLMPGRITHLWFLPDKPLETHVVCVEFCGMAHSQMNNVVKALAQPEYDAWLAKKLEKKKAASLETSTEPATATVR